LNIAIRAARRAGEIIVRGMNRVHRLDVRAKGQNDFVSEIDTAAERDIIETVRKHYPNHAFLAEESGQSGTDDEFVWIIDPLDGTTNFLHGYPQFAVSIGVQRRGRMEHAVVYDPLRQELFTASRGEGAQLDGKRIRVTPAHRPGARAHRHRLSVSIEPAVARLLHGDAQGSDAGHGRHPPSGLSGARSGLCRGWTPGRILGAGPLALGYRRPEPC
jgi:fructose-1,6-bisphosphatase/inositol monophosphatase family enzyme